MEAGEATYDPISYHHGSVWPLYTGWASLAEYRANRPLAGYANLKHNAQLTWLQDPGAVTEVLSGEFYQPLGRSSSHQLWSSAMVLIPAIRGLFGLEADVLTGRLRIDPKLPAEWSEASLKNVSFGDARLNLQMHREGMNLDVEVTSSKTIKLCLQNSMQFFDGAETPCSVASASTYHERIPLPEVEVGLESLPAQPGEQTRQMKMIRQEYGDHSLVLKLDVPPQANQRIFLRVNRAGRAIKVTGAKLGQNWITVTGDPGGYSERTVEITW